MHSKVLIVDDSNMDSVLSEMVIKKYLFAQRVVSRDSVMEGLSYLQSLIDTPEKLPDVILLDVNMPVMNGFDFLDRFMKLPDVIQNNCSIFMISATNSLSELDRIKTYSIVRKFFNKPLTIEILNDIDANLRMKKTD